MTSREAIKLAKRVEFWQKKLTFLGVGHWRIESVSVMDETPGGPRANASVQPSYTYDSASFYFQTEYAENATQENLDQTIIHEWLHVAMRDLDQAIESVEGELSPHSCARWEDWVGHEREGFVDRLARQLYALHNENT